MKDKLLPVLVLAVILNAFSPASALPMNSAPLIFGSVEWGQAIPIVIPSDFLHIANFPEFSMAPSAFVFFPRRSLTTENGDACLAGLMPD